MVPNGLLYAGTLLEPSQSRIDSLPTVIIDWYDGLSDDVFDVKFTVIINASVESYKGGEFNLFLNKPTHINKLDNPGDVIMFKSNLYHKVNPVSDGKRHSISIFYKGPRFV